jgi:hypothetical protein
MKITRKEAKILGKLFKVKYSKTPFSEWVFGLNVETEHAKTINGDIFLISLIVLDHLKENPRYYHFLKEMEKSFNKHSHLQ